MTIIDDRTANLNLPLPNINNKVVDDIARLRTAFSSVDSAVVLKADAATTYSKTQVDSAIAGATPNFGTLTGKPTTLSGFGITDAMTATAIAAAIGVETTRSTNSEGTLTANLASEVSNRAAAITAETSARNTAIGTESARATAAEALLAPQATTYTKVQTDAAIQAVIGAAPIALATLAAIDAQLASDESAAGVLTTAVAGKAPLASPTFTGTVGGVTAAMVGLGNVNNTSDAAKPISTAQAAINATLAPLASPTFTGTISGITGAMVGLANVNNTTDLLKPISTATQAALDLKANQATTYTKVETDTRIQAVVGAAPAALDTLVEIAAQLASDESAAAALTTAVSLKAPLASPTFTGTVSGITKAMVGLGSVDNTTDAAKPISTATQTALDLKANSAALGTMSAQSASAVEITGGTITGVTFNGGTY